MLKGNYQKKNKIDNLDRVKQMLSIFKDIIRELSIPCKKLEKELFQN